ncbi:hypothetical protein ACIBK9_44445 [Nonomuraea sp. NPDC050227]|uniref:hypothetical protein n=1 Tax=Nonomuraea sp. NPDC050227 TaxID=3364360 RepID=UPI0037A14CAE
MLIELPQVLRYLDFKRDFFGSKKARGACGVVLMSWGRISSCWPLSRTTSTGESPVQIPQRWTRAVHGRGVLGGSPLIPALGEQWDFEDPREFVLRLPRIARHRGL